MFGKKKDTCCICNQHEGNKKILDGMVCKSCMSKCGAFLCALNWNHIPSDRIKQAVVANEVNQRRLNSFRATNSFEKYIDIDENNRLWRSPSFMPNLVFSYDDIINYELLEDGETITKGSLGNAVVGGVVFGGVGAIVGSNIGSKKTKKEINEYRIKIVTNNICFPEVYINFLASGIKIKSSSILYKTYTGYAQRVLSLLSIITSNSPDTTEVPTSAADEIKKYKNLLNEGIITQEEFDAKKKQLLNL